MDAPAMLTRKHVPEDVGLRNHGEDEGAGQQQLHRDEKQHKPVLKKVKDKVKKIKNTLAGHSHGHGNGHGGEHDDRVGGGGNASGNTSSSEEGEEDMLEREAAMEKGGYMDDVEDKPLAMETDPEVHGAPMYESARTPAVHDLVAKYEPPRMPAVQDVQGDSAAPPPRVRLGDIGGPVVEDPAAPRSRTQAAREGEDIGTTPVTKAFEKMTVSDDPAHVGAGKTSGARPEEWKDAAAEMTGASGGGATYTEKLKNAAAGTTEYGKKLASTVYEKVAGVGGAVVGTGKRDDEHADAMPVSEIGGEEFKDAPAATDAMDTGASAPGYTDKIKSAAAGTTGYGKQIASTVYEKVAGVGTAVAPNLRPQVGAAERDHARDETMPLSDTGVEHQPRDTVAATDAPADSAASGATYTDKIKSAAAGTTGYGKQLASTVYEKVAGVGTAVAGKVQGATQSTGTATPGVGAQPQDSSAAATANPGAGTGQDKGVTMTGYIADMLRPGDEDRALSESISGAVQRRKEEAAGSTVAQRVPAPSQVITKAREAVSSLTGGNRVSEAVAVQPTTEGTGRDAKDGVAVAAVEEPMVHVEEIHGAKLNTNTM